LGENAANKKIPIKIEAIKTPLGAVPTLKSFKQVLEGLNILNADMIRTQEMVSNEMFKTMAGIEKELKSLRKLISEEIISSEAIKENINALNKRLDKIDEDEQERIKDLSSLIMDFIGSVRVFQDQVTRLFKETYSKP
jgi:septal ring factor EnvC (AmiA/AmiB activator)